MSAHGAGARRSLGTRLGRWAIVIGFAVLLAFPFYWMLITSFKQTSDLYNIEHNPFIFNARPTLSIYAPGARSVHTRTRRDLDVRSKGVTRRGRSARSVR